MKKSFLGRGDKGLRRVGKIGRRNISANRKIAKMFQERGIVRCEICGSTFGLSFHHKHHRYHYYGCPQMLSDFGQVILLCAKHHNQYQPDSTETLELFKRLR